MRIGARKERLSVPEDRLGRLLDSERHAPVRGLSDGARPRGAFRQITREEYVEPAPASYAKRGMRLPTELRNAGASPPDNHSVMQPSQAVALR